METHRMRDSEERARDGKSSNEESLLSDSDIPEHKHNESTTTSLSQGTFYTTWVQDWWLVELMSLALGTGTTVAVVFILLHYQDKPAPQLNSVMGMGITLNTIIAILVTIGRASALLAVAECISQQKWAWFSGSSRPLTELDIFDQGSRGAFGALLLMWKIKMRNIVSIGALLLIFGLAVDPMSQALLSYEMRPQPDFENAAYVDTAYTWDTYSLQAQNVLVNTAGSIKGLTPDPPLVMQAAVLNGLFTSNTTLNSTIPVCATGNCSWESYRSLAVCTRWQDVSSHVKHEQAYNETSKLTSNRWSLTDRASINNGRSKLCQLNMTSVATPKRNIDDYQVVPNALQFDDSIAFKDSKWPIADVFIVYSNESNPEKIGENVYKWRNDYSALEFVLEWCVQEFNTSVVNGTAVTTRLNSTNAFDGETEEDVAGKGTVANLNADISRPLGTDRYSVDNGTHYFLANYLRKILDGTVYSSEGTTIYKTSDAAEAFWFTLFAGKTSHNRPSDKEIRDGLSQALQNIATSMTNVVRQPRHTLGSTGSDYVSLENTLTRANGTAWREQAFVQVQWGWIAAPVLLALLSIIFVVATIVQSSRQANQHMVWKSSTFPTLLALSEELHGQIGGVRSLSENERTLKYAKASLTRDEEREWWLHGSLDG